MNIEARVQEHPASDAPPHLAETLTHPDATMGTPAYMAPEQITGDGREPALDQYALGVIAYELFTGRRPFDDDQIRSWQQLHLEPVPPGQHVPLPAAVNAAILRMLEKDPSRRFASLPEATAAWERALRGEGPRARSAAPPASRCSS